MATFDVFNTNDTGAGSLRDAINMANTNGEADIINFDSSLSGMSIGLTTGELLITEDLTINGLGTNSLTIDAGMNGFRVFNIDDGILSNFIDVLINDLTITGGSATGNSTAGSGGGINSIENLTVTDSTITGNTARFNGGGLYARFTSTANIINSTISDNTADNRGGGIATDALGSVTITNSAVSGNTAEDDGGGIYFLASDVEITNSTISGNTAEDNGGGIYLVASDVEITNSTISGNTSNFTGGGISVTDSEVEITNSTVSDNTAEDSGGGILLFSSDAEITSSTVSGNTSEDSGGGILLFNSDAEITNTIIANTTNGGDCVLQFGSSIGTNINNLIEDGSCNPLISGDPNLGPLQDNGGLTETQALLSGSIAIDAGDNAGAAELMFDQRGSGFDRMVNGTVDIGAFEVQSQPPPISVPEPSSLIGLVAFCVGTLAISKRRWKQK